MRVLDRYRVEDMVRTSPTQNPLLAEIELDLEPAAAGFSRLRERFAKPLTALMAVVALLLLLACINIAGVMLARAAARDREMALRVSLGASRLRLVRQALTESLLLASFGAAAGIVVAYVGAEALIRTVASGRRMPGAPPIEIDVQLDPQVLLFTAAVTAATGLLFGLAPALRAMRAAPASSLRTAGRTVETRTARLFGKSLVAAQVALSMVLLAAAGLFAEHLSNLRHVGVGFERDDLLLVTMARTPGGYNSEELAALLRRLEGLPGVRVATVVGATPISGAAASRFIVAEGFEERHEDRRYTMQNGAGPRYFEAMGTPVIAGREFESRDQGRVAIVNQALAQHYFPAGDPVGKRVTFEGETEPYEIIGLVGNAKYLDLRKPPPRTIYLPAFRQGRVFTRNFVLRTDIDPAAVTAAARSAIEDALAEVPVEKVTTMAAQMDDSIVPERLVAALSRLFGGLGAALAAIGLYGLLTYFVTRRTNEIGVRMALGATQRDVTGMVVRDALGTVCAGLAIGAPAALWGGRFAAKVFEELSAGSTIAIVAAGATMLGVALLASYAPSRRAARVDPIEALQHE